MLRPINPETRRSLWLPWHPNRGAPRHFGKLVKYDDSEGIFRVAFFNGPSRPSSLSSSGPAAGKSFMSVWCLEGVTRSWMQSRHFHTVENTSLAIWGSNALSLGCSTPGQYPCDPPVSGSERKAVVGGKVVLARLSVSLNPVRLFGPVLSAGGIRSRTGVAHRLGSFLAECVFSSGM